MVWRTWETSRLETDPASFWAGVVMQNVVDVDLELLPQKHFFGRMHSRSAGRGRFVSFRSGSHRLRRTPQQAKRNNGDTYLVSLQCRGICNIDQGGETISLRPGDIAIVHSGHPFAMTFPAEVERRLVLIPRELLDDRMRSTPLKCGFPIRIAPASAGARFARDAVLQLTNVKTAWGQADCETVMESLAHLLTAELKGTAVCPTVSPLARPMLADVEAAIRHRIKEPDLSPALIARQCGISVRTLHRLFANGDVSFSRFVLDERLERARAALASASASSTLMALAMELGFNEAAHFSRSYRARFGETPRQTRAATWDRNDVPR